MIGPSRYCPPVRQKLVGLLFVASVSTLAVLAASACARSDPPPGTPAQAAPCPDDAGTELPHELACCLIQARNAEEAQNCLAAADAGP
jgi:hypothetical protein